MRRIYWAEKPGGMPQTDGPFGDFNTITCVTADGTLNIAFAGEHALFLAAAQADPTVNPLERSHHGHQKE
jgi:hypothetical protein